MKVMKIKELARATGLNTETIRKYRERGLLRPRCSPENGYYEYSAVDFLNLLYIRKLRGANLSLDTIASTYHGHQADELLDGYRATVCKRRSGCSCCIWSIWSGTIRPSRESGCWMPARRNMTLTLTMWRMTPPE